MAQRSATIGNLWQILTKSGWRAMDPGGARDFIPPVNEKEEGETSEGNRRNREGGVRRMARNTSSHSQRLW
jgi:hypothetical protein